VGRHRKAVGKKKRTSGEKESRRYEPVRVTGILQSTLSSSTGGRPEEAHFARAKTNGRKEEGPAQRRERKAGSLGKIRLWGRVPVVHLASIAQGQFWWRSKGEQIGGGNG